MHGALRRLATGVQAARAGLAYGAMAEGWYAVAVAQRSGDLTNDDLGPALVAMSVVSLGLFVFGVAMNDVLDRKQDQALAAQRPGRTLVSLQWLTLLAVASLLAALAGAAWFGAGGMVVASIAAAGIMAYNAMARFIPAFAFVSLGAIGAVHMLVPDQHPAPILPFWFSMTFTAIVAGLMHRIRQKRPQATLRGMAFAIALWASWSIVLLRLSHAPNDPLDGFVRPVLAVSLAAAAVAAFVIIAALRVRTTAGAHRKADRLARLATLAQAIVPAAWLMGMDRPTAALLFLAAALGLALLDALARTALHLARPLDYQP